ncbi:SDR family NAD(P)-dependent oxidoreductase [Leifsonia sp. AG29]|uniref:SDR family NAD(P)-dependent oxidoreductase n=1 Tax=Leifsonia sp. AG29 TaxID=2598860 RepID=UPI00131CB43C|nr:SDR family NAD(P)-dependent oxidoreductase [Leifsonia sp. AG29]
MLNRVVLITGASSGIGRATALQLLTRGATVVAGARNTPALIPLHDAGADTIALDVTDAESRANAVEHVVSRHGRLDVLINNAGYGPLAPIEETSDELWESILATNVIGPAALARSALPVMRRQGGGTIINIGSMGGEFTTPLGGAYHASKYAVEALTDALRAEAKPFGVKVALVQPGPVRTPMADSAANVVVAEESPYRGAAEHMAETYANMRDSRALLKPEQVAAVVVRAASATRPRARYKVGPVAHVMPFLRRSLPIGTWDAMVSRQAGLNRM